MGIRICSGLAVSTGAKSSFLIFLSCVRTLLKGREGGVVGWKRWSEDDHVPPTTNRKFRYLARTVFSRALSLWRSQVARPDQAKARGSVVISAEHKRRESRHYYCHCHRHREYGAPAHRALH